jgi:hypothetical protein
MLLYFIAP